jgi:hypothetical protein
MEIRDIKKDQFGRFGGLTQLGLRDIMTAQGASRGLFFSVAMRSRLTVYKGSGDVTFNAPRFHLTLCRLMEAEIAC